MKRVDEPPMDLRFVGIHVLAPLLLGGSIYILFRSRGLLMFHWWESLQLMPGITALRELAAPVGELLPAWVLYSLPDGAWLYSFIAFIRAVWSGGSRRWMMAWICLPLVMGPGLELGQGLGLIEGTFDWLDLGLYGLAILAAFRANLPASDPG